MIYHLIHTPDWIKAEKEGVYQPASFEEEGFIHFSTKDQVCETAKKFYAGANDLLLLEVDEKELGDKVKMENTTGGENLYPHLYDRLMTQYVNRVYPFRLLGDGEFYIPAVFI